MDFPSIAASEEVRVRARDGRSLAATLYIPQEARQHFVVINGATGVRRGYYQRYARFLAERGFHVLTYDYRGIGGSVAGRVRDEACDMRQWGEIDTASVIDFAAGRYLRHRLSLVGHSAGGQLLGLADNNRQVEAMLAVSAQSGYWKHWRGRSRLALAALWYGLMPGLTGICRHFPGQRLGLGEDLPAGVAREWARWCRHPSYMVDRGGAPLRHHFTSYDGRIRAYAISDDWMAPKAAVEALMGFYRSASVELMEVEPRQIGAKALGHFGYFKEAGRPMWREDAEWLGKAG